MQVKLPYLASPGALPKVLAKIEEARRPERFTQDFLETKLGLSGGSFRATIPLLKRMGFLSSDGTPTTLYDQYRNPTSQRTALAEGTRNAYSELFDRNRFANDMTREKLSATILEMTGLEKDSSVAKQIVATFWALKDSGDFESASDSASPVKALIPSPLDEGGEESRYREQDTPPPPAKGLNLAYTINLNLPESTDPEVFNAIFRALRQNLLVGST